MQATLRSDNTTFTKRTITQVRKEIATKGAWSGLVVPNRVNTFHLLGGWHLGHEASFSTTEELEEHVSSMLYYMERELGNRVAFYELGGN